MRLASFALVLHITCILVARGLALHAEGKHDREQNAPSPGNLPLAQVPVLDVKAGLTKPKPEVTAGAADKAKTVASPVLNGTHTSSNYTEPQNKLPHMPGDQRMQSGALMRGFFVLLGITVILLIYLGLRMFRLGKGTKPPMMVRKYGVLTNRADVEMLPLPLSEDEDDDTVFEINNHINR